MEANHDRSHSFDGHRQLVLFMFRRLLVLYFPAGGVLLFGLLGSGFGLFYNDRLWLEVLFTELRPENRRGVPPRSLSTTAIPSLFVLSDV